MNLILSLLFSACYSISDLCNLVTLSCLVFLHMFSRTCRINFDNIVPLRCFYWLLRLSLRFALCLTPGVIKEFVGSRIVILSVCLVRTSSKGSVSVDSRGRAVFEMKYLQDDQEVKDLKVAWNESTRILQRHPYFKSSVDVLPGVIYPGCDAREDSLLRYAEAVGTTYYHYHSTVSSKTCLNDKYELSGTTNVVVSDASALDACVEAGTAKACVDLGRRVGDGTQDRIRRRRKYSEKVE